MGELCVSCVKLTKYLSCTGLDKFNRYYNGVEEGILRIFFMRLKLNVSAALQKRKQQ